MVIFANSINMFSKNEMIIHMQMVLRLYVWIDVVYYFTHYIADMMQ